MMWYESEFIGEVQPIEVDINSSQKVNYIRKDFVSVPVLDEEGNDTGQIKWKYKECKVAKEAFKDFLDIESLKNLEELKTENKKLKEIIETQKEINNNQDLMLLELLEQII